MHIPTRPVVSRGLVANRGSLAERWTALQLPQHQPNRDAQLTVRLSPLRFEVRNRNNFPQKRHSVLPPNGACFVFFCLPCAAISAMQAGPEWDPPCLSCVSCLFCLLVCVLCFICRRVNSIRVEGRLTTQRHVFLPRCRFQSGRAVPRRASRKDNRGPLVQTPFISNPLAFQHGI